MGLRHGIQRDVTIHARSAVSPVHIKTARHPFVLATLSYVQCVTRFFLGLGYILDYLSYFE